MPDNLLTGKTSDFLKIGVGAAARGDLDTLKQILEIKPHWRARIGSHGRTMVWEAAYRGRLNVVSYLLETYDDIDIEARGCHFTPMLVEVSPLCAAAYKKRNPVVERLEEAGAQWDVLTYAFLGHYNEVKQLVLEKPNLVKEEFSQHDPSLVATLMHYAISSVNADMVDFLLEQGANVKQYNEQLLKYSLWRGNFRILEALLKAGLDPSEKNLLRGDIDDDAIVDLLKQFGATIDINASNNGWPSLVYLCRGDRGGNPDEVRKLISQGADINIRNYKGQSALHCAAKAGFVKPVAILLDHGADVNAKDQEGDTPLHAVCKSTTKNQLNLQQIIDLLKKSGADTTQRNRHNRTPSDVLRRKSSLEL